MSEAERRDPELAVAMTDTSRSAWTRGAARSKEHCYPTTRVSGVSSCGRTISFAAPTLRRVTDAAGVRDRCG